MQRGFSTIELLIAFAVALMFLSGMYIVVFADQTAMVSGETNAEAVAKTQALIEMARAKNREDFNLVNATSTTDGIYTKTLTINLLSDFLTKQVVASTTWTGEHGQSLHVSMTSLVTNIDNVHSPNSCNSSLTNPDGWKNPEHHDFSTQDMLPQPASSGITVSGVDVLQKRLYVISDSAPSSRPETFFIFDTSSGLDVAPTFLGRVDNNVSNTEGIAALTLASTSDKIYAYVANARGSNFGTCSRSANCSQLQVLDVTTPTLPAVVGNYLLPTSTAPFVLGTGGQASGKSIYYKDGYLYLGLKLAASGPEFVVLDVGGGGVGSSTNPVFVGSYNVNFTVNAITVKGDYAYLATNDTAAGNKRLLVLNVSDKSSPRLTISPVGGFFTAGGIGVGNAISVVGSKIYFGTAFSGTTVPNFYILNGSIPGSYPTAIPKYGMGTIAGTNDSVKSIIVRDYLAFLLTNTQFQVWNIANPAAPIPWTSNSLQTSFLPLSALGGNGGVAADCEGDTIYIASKSSLGTGRDVISVLNPAL